MDDTTLSELERLAKEATPGPWHRSGLYAIKNEEFRRLALTSDDRGGPDDAAFIAACNPVTVLELIAKIRRLQTVTLEQRGNWESWHAACVAAEDDRDHWKAIAEGRAGISPRPLTESDIEAMEATLRALRAHAAKGGGGR